MPKRRNGERWTCTCGAQLISAETKAGREAPIRIDSTEDGNVLLFRSADRVVEETGRPVLECRNLGRAEVVAYLREQGVPLRLNHFADCPDRERFETAKR